MKNALDTAHDLGLRLPTYTETDRPELFQAWADRVALVEAQSASGRDTGTAVAEARIYDGHPSSAVPYPAPMSRPIDQSIEDLLEA